jgi:hypothetical protein
MKKTQKTMELNKETAMRLWNESFGKATKVKDYTGREIAKGAYNNRNSEFGWNVDHILPQSRGGKTNDSNLIVCHILTNDEKADKFPAFKANNQTFEIIKVQNHYEIYLVDDNHEEQEENDDSVNFMDSASGVRFFKKLKGIQNKPRFVGTVLIRLANVKNTAIIDFIEKFLDEENISYSLSRNYYNSETRIIAKNYNMPLKEDVNKLLDKCILLNTYLKEYFVEVGCISEYDIYFRVDYFIEKTEMYIKNQTIEFNQINYQYFNTLFINQNVYVNTDAKEKRPELKFDNYNNFYNKFDYVFVELSKNLNKEASK